MTPRTFNLHLPETITCGTVFSSPHSGRDYSADFLASSVLDPLSIRSSEDAFVDELFAAAPKHGAPLLAASAPRAYVDLNRGQDELDPALIEGAKKSKGNPRVASGLGVIPRVVSESRALMQGKMTMEDAQTRLNAYYHPYHTQLQHLLTLTRASFGQVFLIDCHSMPHESLKNVSGVFGKTPEIVLGDRFGSSCDGGLVDQIEALLINAGFSVARNIPFAGAYITQAYGRPSSGQHCLQIEIDRALYMNETTITKSKDFEIIRAKLTTAIEHICDATRWSSPMAAE